MNRVWALLYVGAGLSLMVPELYREFFVALSEGEPFSAIVKWLFFAAGVVVTANITALVWKQEMTRGQEAE